MGTAIFPGSIPFAGYRQEAEDRVLISEAESGAEQRRSEMDGAIRFWRIDHVNLTPSDMQTLFDFLLARGGRLDNFYLKDKFLADYHITGEVVNASYNGEAYDTLDHYPVETTTQVYYAGVLKTEGVHYSVDRDTKRITYIVAPTTGQAVTCNYDYYRKARYDAPRIAKDIREFEVYQTETLLKEDLE